MRALRCFLPICVWRMYAHACFLILCKCCKHFGAQKYIEHQSTQKSCTALKSNARGTSQHRKAAIAIRKKSELDFVHTPAAAEKKL